MQAPAKKLLSGQSGTTKQAKAAGFGLTASQDYDSAKTPPPLPPLPGVERNKGHEPASEAACDRATPRLTEVEPDTPPLPGVEKQINHGIVPAKTQRPELAPLASLRSLEVGGQWGELLLLQCLDAYGFVSGRRAQDFVVPLANFCTQVLY